MTVPEAVAATATRTEARERSLALRLERKAIWAVAMRMGAPCRAFLRLRAWARLGTRASKQRKVAAIVQTRTGIMRAMARGPREKMAAE
jgi:hypothetical protein